MVLTSRELSFSIICQIGNHLFCSSLELSFCFGVFPRIEVVMQFARLVSFLKWTSWSDLLYCFIYFLFIKIHILIKRKLHLNYLMHD